MKLFRFGGSLKPAKLEHLGNPWKSRPRISKCPSENRLGEDADYGGRLDVGSNLGLNGHDLSLTNYVETVAGMLLCAIVSIPHGSDVHLQSARSWPLIFFPKETMRRLCPESRNRRRWLACVPRCGPVPRADEC